MTDLLKELEWRGFVQEATPRIDAHLAWLGRFCQPRPPSHLLFCGVAVVLEGLFGLRGQTSAELPCQSEWKQK